MQRLRGGAGDASRPARARILAPRLCPGLAALPAPPAAVAAATIPRGLRGRPGLAGNRGEDRITYWSGEHCWVQRGHRRGLGRCRFATQIGLSGSLHPDPGSSLGLDEDEECHGSTFGGAPGVIRQACLANSDLQDRMVFVPETLLDRLLQTEASFLSGNQLRAVSMRDVLDCLQPHRAAKFIHQELPKRVAVRLRMIENLQGWRAVPEFVKTYDQMQNWYRDMRLVQRNPRVGLKEFLTSIKRIRGESTYMVPDVVEGMHKLHSSPTTDFTDEFVNTWLDDFFMIRIGSNMLVDQCIAIASLEDGGLGKPTGIVDTNCDATIVCKQAAEYAKALCRAHLGRTPVYIVETYSADDPGAQTDEHPRFSYIPTYLRYIMIELLKNAFKATCENIPDEAELSQKPIRILVCSDGHHCAIRVSDQAGGIPFHVGKRIWSYMYGAATRDGAAPGATALSGWGVGLPISRLHARYLGGTLRVATFPGYGTDVFLHLPIIESNQVEDLKKSCGA